MLPRCFVQKESLPNAWAPGCREDPHHGSLRHCCQLPMPKRALGCQALKHGTLAEGSLIGVPDLSLPIYTLYSGHMAIFSKALGANNLATDSNGGHHQPYSPRKCPPSLILLYGTSFRGKKKQLWQKFKDNTEKFSWVFLMQCPGKLMFQAFGMAYPGR
ncbi:hypothetical protein BDV11DRAFT_181291 [Aspergillus similis]